MAIEKNQSVANVNYLFGSSPRHRDLKIRLFPALEQIGVDGIRRQTEPAVRMEFVGGRFILDDTWRRKYYNSTGSRKLDDKKVLQRMTEISGFDRDFFFVGTIDNIEAKKQMDAMKRLFGEVDAVAASAGSLAGPLKDLGVLSKT